MWRVMRLTDEELPQQGTGMTSLGVRVRDLHPRLDGTVDPQEGGVSVSPEGYEHLPRAAAVVLKNKKGVIFMLETENLSKNLTFREDPLNKSHGFIEPTHPMKFEAYQNAVQATSERWQPV